VRNLFFKAVSLPLLATAFSYSAHAIPIVGSSGGSFTNLSSCDSTVPYQNCRIVGSTNGANTQVQWGSTSWYSDFIRPSTLTSVDVQIDTNTDSGLGVVIGRLDWYNSATLAKSDLNDLAVRWTLSLNFTAPSGPDTSGNEVFDLTIYNPLNPPGDLLHGLRLADLSSLDNPVSLAGVSMTNLRYSLIDAPGGGIATFENNVWYNDEDNTSTMLILADFRARVAQVPEPAGLTLLGLGLIAVAISLRRRRRS
jgi:hypothetical protein